MPEILGRNSGFSCKKNDFEKTSKQLSFEFFLDTRVYIEVLAGILLLRIEWRHLGVQSVCLYIYKITLISSEQERVLFSFLFHIYSGHEGKKK